MTAQEIIDILKNAGAEDTKSMLDALCDGATLAELGITDKDQEAVEEAYAQIKATNT